jgi:hypothetical protein
MRWPSGISISQANISSTKVVNALCVCVCTVCVCICGEDLVCVCACVRARARACVYTHTHTQQVSGCQGRYETIVKRN